MIIAIIFFNQHYKVTTNFANHQIYNNLQFVELTLTLIEE